MRLRDGRFKSVYRTDEDNILSEFYVPALRIAATYDRAVGFFSAGMLSMAAQGLSAFVRNGGQMRLIIGAELKADETEAIATGYALRNAEERLAADFGAMLTNISDDLFHRRIELLSFLVASGRLDIRVALRRQGMYHEKIGIFTDATGDKVVFQGSANETVYALLPDYNFESINVFEGWRPELHDHVEPHLRAFERVWENRAKNTLVLEFPEALRRHFIRIAKEARLPTVQVETAAWKDANTSMAAHAPAGGAGLRVPDLWGSEPFSIRKHQRDALQAWKANALQGVFALATGAGKTVTALYGAAKVFEASGRMALIIAVPYQNLADQWVAELQRFGVSAFRCYGSTSSWNAELSVLVGHYESRVVNFLCCVVVNRTLCGDDFQRVLGRISGGSMLFVGDECHHHGNPSIGPSLPAHAAMRLGLSATPEHYLNQEANGRLFGYYGQIVSRFSLQDALDAEILTPYYYSVVPVELEPDELEAYRAISLELSRRFAAGGDPESDGSQDSMHLLLKRARVVAGARNKLRHLEDQLRHKPPGSHTLFYCGDGTTSEDGDTEDRRHVDVVGGIVARMGWKVARFTAQESRQERTRILDEFRIGLSDGLVAIRCLDEGIDVPACRRAYFLASSRNPRQFVQRRGRILRRAPGKDFAEIIDFVVVPPHDLVESSTVERKLLIGELQRVAEFARSAMNATAALQVLGPALDAFNLHHYLV